MNNKINEIIGRLGVNKEVFYNKLMDWESEGVSEEDLVYVSLLYAEAENLIDLSINRSFKEVVDFFEKNLEKYAVEKIKINVFFYLNKYVFLKENKEYIKENKEYLILTDVRSEYKKYFTNLNKKSNLFFCTKKNNSDFLEKGDSFIFNKDKEYFMYLDNNQVYNIENFFKNELFLIINFVLLFIYSISFLMLPFLFEGYKDYLSIIIGASLAFVALINVLIYRVYKYDNKEIKEKIDMCNKLLTEG